MSSDDIDRQLPLEQDDDGLNRGGFSNRLRFDSSWLLGWRPAWMAKPLSMDLRERAVRRVGTGQSVRAVAEQLSVSPSSVVKWSQRLRRTGSVAPGKMGGHRRPKIAGAWREWLVARMAKAEFTLRGLVSELAEQGLKVDYRTMWKFVHAEGLSFKKRPFGRPSSKGRTWQGGGPPGRSTRTGSTPGGLCLSTRPGRRPTWHPSGDGE